MGSIFIIWSDYILGFLFPAVEQLPWAQTAKELGKVYSYASRHDQPLSLVMAALEYFKRVNDTYGQPVGDRVLVTFA